MENHVEQFLLATGQGFRILAAMNEQPAPAPTLPELVYVLGRGVRSSHVLPVSKRINVRECYWNALQWTKRSPSPLAYCEGYAVPEGGLLPVLHGYCLDASGQVVDPSWSNQKVQYFGIAFEPDFYQRAWAWLGMHNLIGILPNLGYMPRAFIEEMMATMQRPEFAERRAHLNAPELGPLSSSLRRARDVAQQASTKEILIGGPRSL